jgi:hypothetical protein
MDLASNERIAVTASRDGTWRLWDVRTGRQMHCEHSERGFSIAAFSPDGRWFATNFSENAYPRLRIWETASRQSRSYAPLYQTSWPVAAVSPDGKWTMFADRVQIEGAQLDGPKLAPRISLKHETNVCALTFSPNGDLLASCDEKGTVYLWDVHAPPEAIAKRLTDQARLDSWNELASGDAKIGFRAIIHLEQDSGSVEDFLHRFLKPAAEGNSKQIARWISTLDSKNYSERDGATRQLVAAGEAANAALISAWSTELTPEARSRVRRLLERLDAVPPPETLQTLRAIEVLERRGKPEAIPILKRLAAGAPGFAVTIDAQETLERMDKRK